MLQIDRLLTEGSLNLDVLTSRTTCGASIISENLYDRGSIKAAIDTDSKNPRSPRKSKDSDFLDNSVLMNQKNLMNCSKLFEVYAFMQRSSWANGENLAKTT